MEFSLTEVIRTYLRHYRTRKFLRKFARVLGCIVAFVTTYALILPAITLEQESFCGFEEHTHTEACYQMQIQNRRLVCNGTVSDLHVHSGSCYNADGIVLCGQADYVVHIHNDSCRDGSGALVCTMAERAQHSHGDSCYRMPDPVPHTHKDTCAEPVKGELLCTQQEDPGHQHGTGCYQPGSELLCTKAAGHQHTDDCYVYPLICTLSADPHSHDGHCYTRGTLLCSVPENHVHQGTCFETNITCGLSEYDHSHDSACYVTDLVCTEAHEEHTDGCWESRLSCGLTEGGHHHTDSCKTVSTVCGTQEGHTHGDGCYEKNLSCGKTGGEVHSHGSGCYGTEKQLNCSLDENHIHENTCYKQELFCKIPESEGHAHGDTCYQWDSQYICGLEEGAPETGEKELVCTEPAAPVHVHGDACFEITQTDAAPICGTEHDHTYTCYSLNCTLEEHTHTLQCYSNPDADVENISDWENTVKDLELTGDWNLDVVAVAESQLGYQESTRNYTVWEDNTLHGYTRYGAWYGVPNGDWCGMFASFCLNYGGVKGMPYNYGTRPWITDLSKPELDLYRTAEDYIPIPGDLVFFDWDPQDGLSDHVGIVYEVIEATEIEKAKLKTIEGNSSNCVQFRTYDLNSPVLLGYSMLPENPDVEYGCDLTKHVHNKRDCYDGQDNLICEKTVHIHSKDCITEKPDDPVYYCGQEVHVHEETCYDEAGELTCQQPEHEHTEACHTEPEPMYYCGQEVHFHEATCYDEAGELTCQQPEHEHTEACQTEPEPVYYCGQDVHVHEENCYDEAGELTCQQPEHEHTEACQTEPEAEYSCGQEAHIHGDGCYDETGGLICEQAEHTHEDACLTEQPVYYCGQEVHIHEQICYDEAGALICQKSVHDHTEECLIRYYCGKEPHIHDAKACHDADGNLICEQTEHTHTERCRYPLMTSTGPKFYCGLEVHTHEDTCYDSEHNLTCQLQEHIHDDSCLIKPPEYLCGAQEHTHTDACKDAAGGLICGMTAHNHTSLCLADLSDLEEAARKRVEEVIRMIDEIPSAEELEAKQKELAEVGDEDAEEQWMMEVYQKISQTYGYYSLLEEKLQLRVVNREKLLALEFVWSMMPLATHYVWLDGTNGGISSLLGWANTRVTVVEGSFTLPTYEQWKNNWPEYWSEGKYDYTVRGWYNITDKTYHAPGERVTISKNTVFYADWVAKTYDIGKFDAHVVDTVSTNSFVTTRLFDYSSIFNMPTSSYQGNVNGNSHSETWSIIQNGGNGLVLRDWDEAGDTKLTRPTNYSGKNTFAETVTTGLWDDNPSPYDLFFNPDNSFDPDDKTGYMGVEYLGTADHLFQYDTNPNSKYHGYFYYDSSQNAASYNQSAGRFYVYDYLERARNSDSGAADFLPFNSPYANTNGKNVVQGSMDGKPYYQYDHLYGTDSGNGCSANNAGINYWFGMSTNIRFYLPQKPGYKDASGLYGNRSIYGDEMTFEFSGDDDVWVLVDNKLVLDIGGIHRAKTGTINFSTGEVFVDGVKQADVTWLNPGAHNLTMYYMERGASQSNCHIYFNICPRFMLTVNKEDLLTNNPLKDVTFGVYTDPSCAVGTEAKLWPNYQASQSGASSIHTFTTNEKGEGSIWGLAAGNTYYIREEAASGGYKIPNGLIKMVLDNRGIAHYSAVVIPNPAISGSEATNPSPGFTAQLIVDERTQTVNLRATNSRQEGESTEVFVRKQWAGGTPTPVTVYLLADGQRINECVLSMDNNWEHTWTNLPKFKKNENGESEEIIYTVEEGKVPGFVSKVEDLTQNTVATVTWEQVDNLENGRTFLLKSQNGFLATTQSGGLHWISSEDAAKASGSAQWIVESLTAAPQGGHDVSLRNLSGYYLCYYWNNQYNNDLVDYFYAGSQPGTVNFRERQISAEKIGRRYMLVTPKNNGQLTADYNPYPNSAMFTLYRKNAEETSTPITGLGYKITNTPIPPESQTSVQVTKRWTDRDGTTALKDTSRYQQISVPVKLQTKDAATGKYTDTGQTAVLNLRSGWTYNFSGLPKKDAQGKDIEYAVAEDWETDDWTPQITVTKGSDGTFRADINNVYSRMVTIPVEKVWDVAVGAYEKPEIEIKLYAVNETTKAVQEVAPSVKLNALNNWKAEFTVIPPEEAGVQYYIYEPANGFAPVYENTAEIFINSKLRKVGQVVFNGDTGIAVPSVVTNYVMQELPETGGYGTNLYTAGGLLLVSAALYLLYNKNIKRRRGAV